MKSTRPKQFSICRVSFKYNITKPTVHHYLVFDSTILTGPFLDFSTWKNITIVNLSKNHSSGNIPFLISNLNELSSLTLSNFQGTKILRNVPFRNNGKSVCILFFYFLTLKEYGEQFYFLFSFIFSQFKQYIKYIHFFSSIFFLQFKPGMFLEHS